MRQPSPVRAPQQGQRRGWCIRARRESQLAWGRDGNCRWRDGRLLHVVGGLLRVIDLGRLGFPVLLAFALVSLALVSLALVSLALVALVRPAAEEARLRFVAGALPDGSTLMSSAVGVTSLGRFEASAKASSRCRCAECRCRPPSVRSRRSLVWLHGRSSGTPPHDGDSQLLLGEELECAVTFVSTAYPKLHQRSETPRQPRPIRDR